MIFSVATMVILTHQGQPELLRKPLPILWLLAGATFVSLAIRVGAVLDAQRYFMWMGFAGAVWSFAVFVWTLWMFPKVLQPVSAGLVEQQHEQAKQRVNRLRGEIPT
jgi:peptidoglycan biosynthesis protein MviN/MurJ (putative lipid II flippase)